MAKSMVAGTNLLALTLRSATGHGGTQLGISQTWDTPLLLLLVAESLLFLPSFSLDRQYYSHNLLNKPESQCIGRLSSVGSGRCNIRNMVRTDYGLINGGSGTMKMRVCLRYNANC